MKKLTATQLHENFILIHDFEHGKASMKEWVKKDKTYMGNYHISYDKLFTVIKKIGEDTGYELIMYWNTSYWNKFGEDPLVKEFGGYEDISNLYQAVVELINWWNKN